jgi:hypothetical protein
MVLLLVCVVARLDLRQALSLEEGVNHRCRDER